ncbi:MAG TPA: DUF1207 domain-containing protein [Methylomirabilota bacterium]|nr:DUF1207 domain-containing protein [Methylomirabilota bacterium]
MESKPTVRRWLWRLTLGAALVTLAAPAAGAAVDDPWLAGYVAAVLERDLGLDARAVTVRDGVVRLPADAVPPPLRARVATTVGAVRGVRGVEILAAAPPAGAPAAAEPDPPAWRAPLPTGLLPDGHLFAPLLADPRWPHFSVSYRHLLGEGPGSDDMTAVSLGGDVPLYRPTWPGGAQWDLGLQAAVFAVFDLDADSKDLLNADYLLGGRLAYRDGAFSALLRLYHQSSHVGDELLLHTRLERVNLSYEAVDAKLSWDLPLGFRLYGGGSVLFSQEPRDLDPWSFQAGAEFRSPRAFGGGRLRPVAALDLKGLEENGWRPDLSLRAGVQLDSVQLLGRSLQLLLEYFEGHAPDGQFFKRELEYFGFGVHFHL